jgi:ABC-type polysaccharide/polyol phosphate export permease
MSSKSFAVSSPSIDIGDGRQSKIRLAVRDLIDGLRSVHIWPMLGWQEVKQRYRRSMLGPFWLTISTAALIGAMGPLYGKLFGQDVGAYLLHLAVSYVLWQFIAQIITDGCTIFIASEGFIKQVRLPLTIYVLRTTWKNLIFLFHNLIIVVAVVAYVRPPLGWDLLLVPFGLLAVTVNAVWVGMLLGLVSARFRDIPQIIGSIVQVLFFMTPVLWQPGMLGRHAWAVNLNPLYHLLEVVRTPLLGVPVNTLSWLVVIMMAIVGFAVMLPFFARYRARVAYWV